jgi:Mce-associated membrane protein
MTVRTDEPAPPAPAPTETPAPEPAATEADLAVAPGAAEAPQPASGADEAPQPASGADEVGGEQAEPVGRGGRLRRGLVVAVGLAAVAAVVFGALWAFAATSSTLALARDRDAALADARQAAINLNTLDYRNVAAGLDLWQQSSTGQVLAEFEQNREQYAKLVEESRRATVASVADAAVTELDEHAGVARVLVAVDVTVTPEGEAPAVTRQRLQMEMTRTPAGWKTSRLSPVRAPAAAN